MATQQRAGQQSGLIDRLFLKHPRSLGMTWAGHGAGAVKIGVVLIGAGCAAVVHAAVPGLFTQTAGKIVTRIYDLIQSRRAGAANPEMWPDYEI
jgi:hypothetical protein